MSAKALLSALGFVLVVCMFAFSLWAELGPYAWVAAAQFAILDSYFGKATFILTLVLFLIPAMLLLFMFISAGRGAKAVGFGIPALLVLAHFGLAVFFANSAGTQADSSTFEIAARGAGFLPQNIAIETAKLPQLELNQASLVNSGTSEEVYVPFTAAAWPSPDTPVMLKSSPAKLKTLAGKPSHLKGIVRLAPLPYLVRRAWTQNHSLFAVIIEEQATVRGFWLPAAILYGAVLIWGAVALFKSRRAASRQV